MQSKVNSGGFMALQWTCQKTLLNMCEQANKGKHTDILVMEGNVKMSVKMSHLDSHCDHLK